MQKMILTSLVALATAFAPLPFNWAQAQAAPAAPVQAPVEQARPNVLMWMMDDVGFAQIAGFGGLVATPNIDRVAKMGLRYTNYHTAPICSASRAAMLAGRNPHSVNMGGHALAARPMPGYNGVIDPEDGSIAANMKQAGYLTFALGKWDHLPSNEMSLAGPFRQWPVGQGFDRFYGFLAADTNNFDPVLIQDTASVKSPGGADYHLDKDLANQAIAMIQSRAGAPSRAPFFMYYATGTAHAPHHAPQEWRDRYKGKFDMGWDKAREDILKRQIKSGILPASAKLAPMPEGVPAWNTLEPDQKRLYARQMEAFAAALSHADEQFGRVLDALEASGELDNTIVVVTSDNGASAEGALSGTYNEMAALNGRPATDADNMRFIEQWGGPETFPHYAVGWTVAGDTPLRYFKQTAHEGGIRVPFVMAWPKGIKARNELRTQYVHVTDVAPTLMELANVPLAEIVNNVKQAPMEGTSFKYSLANRKAPDQKVAQYTELWGNKALWSKNWSINTTNRTTPWDVLVDKPVNQPWELYDLSKDPGQTTDLAAKYPEKVKELAALFEEQANKFHVNPIENAANNGKYTMMARQADFAKRGGKWVFDGPVAHIATFAAPPITGAPFTMRANVDLPTGKETGPIYVIGGAHGGMALYLKDGVPNFVLRNLAGEDVRVTADKPLSKGSSTLELSMPRKPGLIMTTQDVPITIKANGQTIASKTVTADLPLIYDISEPFDVGVDSGSAVSTDYPQNAPFPGTLRNVVFDFNPPAAAKQAAK
jgi:arylsulfatase A-like enzyme